jgi:hypothetical protein
MTLFPAAATALALTILATLPTSANAAGICSKTADLAATACNHTAASDYNYALGACANLAAIIDREQCKSKAANKFTAAGKLCTAQAAARDAICNDIGQAAYRPAIDPADFSVVVNNPWLPMTPGSVYQYRNKSENAEVTITVTPNKIKLVGVTCIVVHDVNRVDGVIEEDTLDYFAQHKDGSVWYFGEDTISYHNGVASTAGSWRAGLNGAKPGIVMFANPAVGKTYRQEFLLGEAEDVAHGSAINQHVKVPAGTFNNAYVTNDFTAIEPGKVENKFYVRNIGNVLSFNPATGEREELVSLTTSP